MSLFSALPASVPLPAQIECVKREIAYRERVYPRLIEKGSMSPRKAETELEHMRAVLATLQGLVN